MSYRRIPLAEGEYYHIYNRGIAGQPMFLNKLDCEQAMLCLSYYRQIHPPVRLSRFKEFSREQKESVIKEMERKKDNLIDIICFTFMPNHFHLLLRQTTDGGISTFVSKMTNSYTRYFNTKHKRVGPLFQGVFKAVYVEDDEQLIHLSRYIHINPVVSFVIKEEELFFYPWSSLNDYLKNTSSLIDVKPIMSQFSDIERYKKFILDQVGYAKKLEEIKHLIIEK